MCGVGNAKKRWCRSSCVFGHLGQEGESMIISRWRFEGCWDGWGGRNNRRSSSCQGHASPRCVRLCHCFVGLEVYYKLLTWRTLLHWAWSVDPFPLTIKHISCSHIIEVGMTSQYYVYHVSMIFLSYESNELLVVCHILYPTGSIFFLSPLFYINHLPEKSTR
jgi:hypothetical protein